MADETGATYRTKSLIQCKMGGGRAAGTPEQADAVARALGARLAATDEGYKVTGAGYFDRAVNVLRQW